MDDIKMIAGMCKFGGVFTGAYILLKEGINIEKIAGMSEPYRTLAGIGLILSVLGIGYVAGDGLKDIGEAYNEVYKPKVKGPERSSK